MIRFLILCFVAVYTAFGNDARVVRAQTLDVIELKGGIALTIVVDSATGQQTLIHDGVELLRAPSIATGPTITDPEGTAAAIVLTSASPEEGCPAERRVVSAEADSVFLSAPIGAFCTAYTVTTSPGTAIFLAEPELHQAGEVVRFDLNNGQSLVGPVVYAPQPNRGWESLRAQTEGFDPLSQDDLYAAQPVYDALLELWDEDIFILAQHLATRTVPLQTGDLLIQSGCLPSQCAFAIGLLAVDPVSEAIYSAFFNEGAPDVRPDLDAWPDPARDVFERWRAGEFR
ncbi:MAG: hypothetical protein AAGH60_07515 [Pseudomonadota bacterium]